MNAAPSPQPSAQMWKFRRAATLHSRYPDTMLIPPNEREMLLSHLELALRQQQAYKTEPFISRENIMAVQQQLEVLKARLAALPN